MAAAAVSDTSPRLASLDLGPNELSLATLEAGTGTGTDTATSTRSSEDTITPEGRATTDTTAAAAAAAAAAQDGSTSTSSPASSSFSSSASSSAAAAPATPAVTAGGGHGAVSTAPVAHAAATTAGAAAARHSSPNSNLSPLRPHTAAADLARPSRFSETMPGTLETARTGTYYTASPPRQVSPPPRSRPVSAIHAPQKASSSQPERHAQEPTSAPSAQASSSPQSQAIDPVTIPIRTSSNRATANGIESRASHRHSKSPENHKTPRKHKSLSGFTAENGTRPHHRPEVDEKVWLGQSKERRRVKSMHQHPQAQQQQQQQAYGFPMPPTSIPSSPSPTNLVAEQDERPSNAPEQVGERASMEASMMSATMRTATGDALINGDSEIWTSEKENILRGPFEYLEAHPGKDIRSQLITAFNSWLLVPVNSLAIITRVVGMLHTASLLIDDVEDSSQLRRGVPVAHSIFGTAQTINSANYIYFCALQELLKLNNAECVRIYTDELIYLHRGQGMDLFWRDTLTCPSEDDYLEMVGNKTGGLFRLAIKLMCAESPSHSSAPVTSPDASPDKATVQTDGSPADYIPLVNTIGLLFQILDDYQNLHSSTYTANKGVCEDLTEGKFSFPIIHAIRSDPSNLVLINILKQKTRDEEVKRYAVSYMDQKGSFIYTRRVLRGLTKKALSLALEVDRGRGQASGIMNILEKLRVDRVEGKNKSVSIT